MKTQITLLFIVFGFLNGFTQPNIDSLLSKSEVGKQYLSITIKENPSLEKTYYAIIPPVFETYFDTVPRIKANIPDSMNIKLEAKTIETKPSIIEWKYQTQKDSLVFHYLKGENLNQFQALLIYSIETPKKYHSTIICSKEYDFYNEYIPIEKQRIISKSTIKKLASKDEVLHPNQVVIEVSNGKWREFKEVLVPLYSQKNKIIELQRALIKNGYPCKVTGEVDTETKRALVQFQKDNHFGQHGPTGSMELFRKLGLNNF